MSIHLCFSIFSFLSIFLIFFSTPSFSLSLSSPLSFLFLSFYSPLFPSLFLLSQSKLNCCALYAIFPSWPSAHAQTSRLSISQLCFQLVNITSGFPCSPSQSPVLFSLERFGYNCMCENVCVCVPVFL